MATLTVPAALPDAAEDAEQLHKAFAGLYHSSMIHFITYYFDFCN